MTSHDLLEGLGSAFGIAGALLMAARVRCSWVAYIAWIVSSAVLVAWSIVDRHPSLLAQQATFLLINLVGLYRWRKAPI